MNVAIYSGSFNPLHIGHLAIIRHLTGKAGFDCVYLIVSPKNPLKDGIGCESGPARLEAAADAVRRNALENVKVDDIELNMPEPHYTIRTLDALREREPYNTFTLVIGADNLYDIHRWKDWRRILTEYGVAVYPRSGFDPQSMKESLMMEDGLFRIRVLDASVVDISSTEIREGTAAGRDMSAYLM